MVKRKRGEGETDVAVMAPTAGVNGHSWKEKATATNGFVKGKFAKNESDKLKAAIEAYAAANGITVQMLATRSVRKIRGGGVSAGGASGAASSSTSSGGRGLNNAWIVIANNADLPHRTLMSIYNHGCRIANKFNYKGAWSDAEVAKLRSLVATHGKKWTKISEELEREVRGIQQKWKKILDSDRVKKARTTGVASKAASAIASANSSIVGSDVPAAASVVPVAPSKSTGQSREEIVKMLIEQVRANCSSNELWPVTGIKWGAICNSFPGRTIGSLRERWNTILAKNLTFSPVEDNALVSAVAACGASNSAEVPWTRLRSRKEYQVGYTKTVQPPQRPGQHYRRRFMKLERTALAQSRGAWEHAEKQANRQATSEHWTKHLESKKSAPWADRVKTVQAFIAARPNTGVVSSSVISSSSVVGSAVSAVAPAVAAVAAPVTAHSVTAV
jgi:hypothetical protein